ncbi:hypothetical protein DICVIV_07069 [Dictyocaulus viviparus]|uniref:Uncharacterized protein n=1 Tax=Dictyocaulus viviparus TaxID=29172 RepID=A0A0D8XQT8_DICVI|nr:hypothetical protein DICVIV_07069 [Dictyocaulus viviparus]
MTRIVKDEKKNHRSFSSDKKSYDDKRRADDDDDKLIDVEIVDERFAPSPNSSLSIAVRRGFIVGRRAVSSSGGGGLDFYSRGSIVVQLGYYIIEEFCLEKFYNLPNLEEELANNQ